MGERSGKTSDDPGESTRKWWQDENLIIVVLALLIVLALSLAAMYWMRKDPERMVGVASGAFGVVGSLTGAFFGIKIGSRNSKDSMEHVERVMGMMSDSSKNPGGQS